MPYKNKEDKRKHDKRYYLKNNVKLAKCAKQWAKDNPERIKEHNEKWRKSNPEKVKKNAKIYRINNKEEILKYTKGWIKKKRATEPQYALRHNIEVAIRNSLKENKAGRQWESLLGYSVNDLIRHLKKTMPDGFT